MKEKTVINTFIQVIIAFSQQAEVTTEHGESIFISWFLSVKFEWLKEGRQIALTKSIIFLLDSEFCNVILFVPQETSEHMPVSLTLCGT
jgi:hypothetical protein